MITYLEVIPLKENRRLFLLRCLGVPVGLSAAAIHPKTEIPSTFPEPKFRFGQKVEYILEDFDGGTLAERGTVIGMTYELSDHQRFEWNYLIKWTVCHNSTHKISWTPDENEPTFLFEHELKAV